MDALPYVDTLFKEYLLFRGFTNTVEAFNKDLAKDPGCGFQAERITELIFRKLIPGLDCQQLVDFLEFLNMGLYSRLDSQYEPLVSAVEADLLRLFLVTAHTAKRPDKVAEFFKLYGTQLLSNSRSNRSSGVGPADGVDWREWFLLPYLQHPEREQRFQVYFSPEWASLLETSFRNFLAGVMRCLPLPAVLRFNTDRRLRLALQQQVQVLQAELEQCRQQLAEVKAQTHPIEQHQQQQQRQQHAGSSLLQASQLKQPHHQQSFDVNFTRPTAAAAAAAGDEQQHPTISHIQSLHQRDVSLGDWQQQQQQQQQSHASLSGNGRLSTEAAAAAAAAAADPEGQEMKILHHHLDEPQGSGLFELLPVAQQALLGSPAGLDQLPQQQLNDAGGANAVPFQQRRHSRTASVSGGISFELPQLEQQQQQVGGAVSSDQQLPKQLSAEAQGAGVLDASAMAVGEPTLRPSTDHDQLPVAASSSTAPSAQASRRSSSSSAAAAAAAAQGLSTSPVMSWASGMYMASSAAGLRSRHTGSIGNSSSSSTRPRESKDDLTSDAAAAAAAAAVPLVLEAVPGQCRSTTVDPQVTGSSSSSSSSRVTAVAFSPSGGNIATAYSDGAVSITAPPGMLGDINRRASFSCGVSVTSVAWDTRADKLMLIGCAAGGGVRAWHADTKRVVQDVGFEGGFPHVVAVAACPAEPSFVVAANSTPPTAAAGSSSVSGRLMVYNSRSFKRSAVLQVPGDVGLVSLAYSSTGSQLVVGTVVGTALLYEPSSSSSPLRILQVAAAVSASSSSSFQPVQVLWRPPAAAGVNTAASSTVGSSSPSATAAAAAAAGPGGSVLTLCAGVLCEWTAGSSSRSWGDPIIAIDVVTTAASVSRAAEGQLSQQGQQLDQQQAQGSPVDATSLSSRQIEDTLQWVCSFAVSVDGKSCAVLCATECAGVLLMYAAGAASSENATSGWLQTPPQTLMSGSMLAGGGSLSWHPSGNTVVVSSNSSLVMVSLS